MYSDPFIQETSVPSLPRATSSYAEDLIPILNPVTTRVINAGSIYGGLTRAAPTLSMYPWLIHKTVDRAFKDNYFPRQDTGPFGLDEDSVTRRGRPEHAGWDYPIEREGMLGSNAPLEHESEEYVDKHGYWRSPHIAKVPEKLDLYGNSFNVYPDWYNLPRSAYSRFRDLRPPHDSQELVNTLKPVTGPGPILKERLGRNKAAVDRLEKQIGKKSASHTILGTRRTAPKKSYFLKKALTKTIQNRYKNVKANRKS